MTTELLGELKSYIESSDETKIDKTVGQLIYFLIEEGVDSDFFIELLKIISTDNFFNLEKSFSVLKIFEYNLSEINQEQKSLLIKYIKDNFSKFVDTTSCMLLLEILPELFVNQEVLNILILLSSTKDFQKRCLIPHGFKRFIDNCEDRNLSKISYEEMINLKKDPEKSVRIEAEFELSLVKDKMLTLGLIEP